MFNGANNFNSDLSNWDTSSVENMEVSYIYKFILVLEPIKFGI